MEISVYSGNMCSIIIAKTKYKCVKITGAVCSCRNGLQ